MKTIVKTIAGSHLFGLNTENSDTDYKGIYLPSAEQILLSSYPETISQSTGKEFGMFLKNNPSYYSSAYFELLKGRPVPDKLIMKIIRPKNNQIM